MEDICLILLPKKKIIKVKKMDLGLLPELKVKKISCGKKTDLGKKLDFGKGLDFGKALDLGGFY